MIVFLVGENSFERDRALQQIIADFDGQPEMIDSETLTVNQLPDLLMGATLFADKRLVIIKQVDDNKSLWDELGIWSERLVDTTTLVLTASTPDKRTRAYKALQKHAKVIVCDFWKVNETYAAEQWLATEAKARGIEIAAPERSEMIARATRPGHDGKLIIDQLRLVTVLDQLVGTTRVTRAEIDTMMIPSVHENIFALLSAALDGDATRVHEMVTHLSVEEDGHKALGLLASQTVNLAALAAGQGQSIDEIAHDLGAHPFALRPLAGYARKLSKGHVRDIIEAIAAADMRVKRGALAWVTIETALQKIVRAH